MPKTFILSDESVNSYGFRILTSGINLENFKKNPIMHYMHDRYDGVIGRWENIRTEGAKLLADAVFDLKHEVGKEVARQVENGFLKMASVGANIIESSNEPDVLVAGQTRPTVTKSELFEVSIVDRGANKNAFALRLSHNNTPLLLDEQLPIINKQNSIQMKELQTIALALGLDVNADLNSVLALIKLNAEQTQKIQDKLTLFETQLKADRNAVAVDLVDKAIKNNIIPESLKNITLASFEGEGFEVAKKQFEALLQDNSKPAGNDLKLKNFIETRGQGVANLTDESFDYLQKNDPKKLAEIKLNQPETYNQLVVDYAAGKRHEK